MTKSFLNKLNIKPYSYSICSGKIGYSGIQNRIVQFLWLWFLAWFFFYLGPLIHFSLFPCFKSSRIFKCSSCHVSILKLSNPIIRNEKPDDLFFLDFLNLIIKNIEPLIRTSMYYWICSACRTCPVNLRMIDSCSWEQGVVGMNNGGPRS
jgi:hypothetical protein